MWDTQWHLWRGLARDSPSCRCPRKPRSSGQRRSSGPSLHMEGFRRTCWGWAPRSPSIGQPVFRYRQSHVVGTSNLRFVLSKVVMSYRGTASTLDKDISQNSQQDKVEKRTETETVCSTQARVVSWTHGNEFGRSRGSCQTPTIFKGSCYSRHGAIVLACSERHAKCAGGKNGWMLNKRRGFTQKRTVQNMYETPPEGVSRC